MCVCGGGVIEVLGENGRRPGEPALAAAGSLLCVKQLEIIPPASDGHQCLKGGSGLPLARLTTSTRPR